MLSKILLQRENELFSEMRKEKNLFRKLVKVMELQAIAQACNESLYHK